MKVIGVILAGGAARRMGGADKALVELNGRRLIDIVHERLAAQVDEIVISGTQDYGLGISAITDDPVWPAGPVRGVMSAARWIKHYNSYTDVILTAPVDGPRLPADLRARLAGASSAIAAAPDGLHPTFAYWRLSAFAKLQPAQFSGASVSLRKLAQLLDAREVKWPSADGFSNINSAQDIRKFED